MAANGIGVVCGKASRAYQAKNMAPESSRHQQAIVIGGALRIKYGKCLEKSACASMYRENEAWRNGWKKAAWHNWQKKAIE